MSRLFQWMQQRQPANALADSTAAWSAFRIQLRQHSERERVRPQQNITQSNRA